MQKQMNIQLCGVYIGQVEYRYGMRTAIEKYATEELLFLDFTGLSGDACAEKHFHGGVERALHHYPAEHYQYWQQEYGSHYAFQAAGMGENISTLGMDEHNVYLGDRYQWGDAIIEVSQPRSPCYKLNQRWDIANFADEMQATTRCGWLYRVLQTGLVGVHQPLKLLERPDNAMTLFDVCAYFFGDPLNPEGLAQLAEQKKLSKSWRDKVAQRQISGKVEDWQARLNGVVG